LLKNPASLYPQTFGKRLGYTARTRLQTRRHVQLSLPKQRELMDQDVPADRAETPRTDMERRLPWLLPVAIVGWKSGPAERILDIFGRPILTEGGAS
jgi:hypothetical protein